MTSVNAVNFLRRKRAKVSRFQQWDKMFAQIAAVGLVGCLVLLGGLFAYWQYLEQQLTSVQDQQKTQQRVVSQASGNELQYVVYSNRLTTLNGLLKARTSKLRALRFLERILRPGVSFEAITYDFETKELNFRAKAGQAGDVENMLNALREQEVATQVQKLSLADIRRGELGDYTIDITIILKEQV